MEGFTKLPKMQCFKEGGSVKNIMKKGGKVKKPAVPKVSKEDQGPAYAPAAPTLATAPDPEAPAMPAPTMKKGGRAKKETGTVKKYCGGGKMKKYADGGLIETVKEAGTKLKENIIGTPEQNRVGQAALDKQAQAGSKLAKVLGGNETKK